MKKRLTILWLICIALFMAGSGTMWGQAYENRYVSSDGTVGLRRGDAPGTIKEIESSGNINTEFGAGESSTIKGTKVIAAGNTALGTGHEFKPSITPATDIQIGSEYSKNIVILSFNSKGYASGWVNITCWGITNSNCINNATNPGGWLASGDGGDTADGTFYGNTKDGFVATGYINTALFTPNTRQVSYNQGGFTDPFTGETWNSGNNLRQWQLRIYNAHGYSGTRMAKKVSDISATEASWNKYTTSSPGTPTNQNASILYPKLGDVAYFYFSEDKPTHVPYTTLSMENASVALQTPTITGGGTVSLPANKTDDGVPLIQVKGDFIQNLAEYNASLNSGSKYSDINNDNTTNDLASDYLNNYKRPTSIAIEGETEVSNIFVKDLNWWYDRYDARYFEENKFLGEWSMAAGCCHVDNLKAWANNISYQRLHADDGASNKGKNLLDAAVLLTNGANVCVAGDVKDMTTAKVLSDQEGDANNAPNHSETNALIVFPVSDRVTLRTRGNFQMNLAHEKDSVTTRAWYYSASQFPKASADIFLYSKSANTSAHPFAMQNRLGAFAQADITKYSIPAPTQEAKSSIFGVYGDYLHEGKMANIHTDTVATVANGNNPGVIEVGPRTAGKDHYYVYSGGILKNFESCTGLANFTMNFGDNFGKSPHFHITEKHTMYILNYGNNAANACSADIHFYEGATQALAEAFAGAVNDGAMQIQALSDVEFRADATIDASVAGNNLYMLSDAGNVVTQKFNYKGKYASETSRGLLTLWAEDRKPEGSDFTDCANDWPTNRNSNRGNVYLNDKMDVSRGDDGHTETNILAANNVRTASFAFTSDNMKNDTTNIISRKGDVWLGYSIGAPVYDATYNGTGNAAFNRYKFSNNNFTYKVNTDTNAGELNIKAGWDETDNGKRWEGGNIYFTTINAEMMDQGAYPTNITIPFSNEYYCGSSDPATGDLHERRGESMQRYEHAGIIGGVGRCGREHAWAEYEGKFTNPIAEGNADAVAVPSLNYKGNNGNLTVDAGQRGNIIMNTGTKLDFQNNQGSAFFRTRFGDIDLRNKTDVSGMQGSLLLLAQRDDLRELSKVGLCGCAEERNNVYLQDFQYTPNESSGSIFIGADNNIKLNYGGLQNKGTRHDPFLSTDYNPTNPGEKIGTDYPCGSGKYHCDMVDDENQARPLMLDFTNAVGPAPTPITQGGFAAVASDYIDVYKAMNYKGGSGSGMSSVPGTGTLHGEHVAGYGLYMKTQGNKNNWNTNILKHIPKCPMGCEGGCDKGDYLHMVSRMTFHSDARIFANGQKVYLGSPVIEVFGDLELNTEDESGNGTEIVLQADSLILHDSLIVSGNKLKYRSWSGINGDKPIMKFGYSRRTPPVQEYKYKEEICAPCYSYIPGSTDPKHMLDTITIKFKQGDAYVERLNTAVFDHTVLTFVTDSFDHAQGPPILDARFFIDTMKVRNQVVLYADKKHTRNAHFELISEEQKQSKDYAGLYVRHYHMEPIGACGRNYSELWLTKLENKALDVITTSTFGGFGYQHSDVHVEIKAHLSPGFTSLRLRGQCYEQKCGTLKMKDLRLDGGAQLHFSVGTTKGINGEYSDAIDVEKLTTYGTVDVNIEVRPCERMMNRCYPIIYYKSQTPGSLKNLNLVPKRIKIDGEEVPLVLDTSTEGVVYVCVGNVAPPTVVHSVTIPSIAGVTTTPAAGIAYAVGHSNFEFKAKYSTEKPFVVRTNRMFNGEAEVLEGKKNSNGEYEYVIRQVTQNIVLKFGPDYVANMSVNGTAVWSHGETIYIRVEREDIASIYSVAGQLVKRVELPEGDTPIPMQRGVYVVTLKDGSVHKVIVK